MSDALSSPSSGDADGGTSAPETGADVTTTNNDVGNAPSSGADAADASASSAEPPVSDRDGLLSVVQSAVKAKEEPAAPEPPAAKTQDAASDPAAKTAGAKAETDEADPTEQELKAYKPQTRKLIGKLTRQRNDARDQWSSVQPELSAHRELVGYLDKHQLAPEDVNLLLGVGAALRRGDYKAFLDGIEPYRDIALQSIGLAISPDLRPKVEGGEITEDVAKELTRTRLAALRAQAESAQHVQRSTTQTQEATRQALATAVDSWEQGVRSRDPDYALKETMVRRTSQALLRELGQPKTPHEATQMAQRAYDEVTAQFARARPAPQATRLSPSGVSTPSLGAAPEPRNLMEAARLGLARTQRSL